MGYNPERQYSMEIEKQWRTYIEGELLHTTFFRDTWRLCPHQPRHLSSLHKHNTTHITITRDKPFLLLSTVFKAASEHPRYSLLTSQKSSSTCRTSIMMGRSVEKSQSSGRSWISSKGSSISFRYSSVLLRILHDESNLGQPMVNGIMDDHINPPMEVGGELDLTYAV